MRRIFFTSQFLYPHHQFPLWKKLKGKICQFRCYPLLVFDGKWKFSASETSDCKETGGRKGCTSCNAEDHSAIKQWRNQKFSLNSSGTEKVLSFHLAWKHSFSSKEQDHRSLPRDVRFFFLQTPPSSILTPRCPQHKAHLTHFVCDSSRLFLLIAKANQFSSALYSCFSADDGILLASLCLNFTVYSKGFLLCIRHSRI